MTFLPIVERELRVASRKRFTFWSRLAAAGFMLVIFGLFFSYMLMIPGVSAQFGQLAFNVLKWIAFIFAASMGVFMPSDSLSEEKREGTLGLLFLTDLRGHDVVFGKLCSLSLQAFYGLLASFPILALPMLAGGVTVVDFWRSVLVICNTLFLSVAIGLLVSSMSREGFKAMNGALLLSLFFLGGLPWIDLAMAGWKSAWFKPILSIASPGYLFVASPTIFPGEFWRCLILQHVIGWMLLAIACVIVPRSWHDKTTGGGGWWTKFSTAFRFGGKNGRLSFRRKWMDRDHVLWLALRDRWLPRLITGLTVLLGAVALREAYVNFNNVSQPVARVEIFSMGQPLLVLGLQLWMAVQASRLYQEAVRSGAMELMLVTPMKPGQIIRSQWRALVRIFLIPVLLVVVLQLGIGAIQIIVIKKSFAKAGTAAINSNHDFLTYQGIAVISGVLNFVLGMAALGWFGMWMGLTNRKLTMAVIKTVVFVQVLPWIAQMFMMGFGMAFIGVIMAKAFASGGTMPFWIGMLPSMAFTLGKNIFFIAWARKRLFTRFRDAVTGIKSGATRAVPMKVDVAAAPPPPAPISPAVS